MATTTTPEVLLVPDFEDYRQAIDQALANATDGIRTTCFCGQPLCRATLKGHDDETGYPVNINGRVERLWLFLRCICGYDMALWKTGIRLPAERTI